MVSRTKTTSKRAAGPPSARARTTGSDVAAHIREGIRTGELEPGAWLREGKLCADFGVGRFTVREALRVLAEDGLIKYERHRGAQVASLTLFEMFDLFELRAALYGLASRFACFRATDAALAEIRAKIERLVEAGEAVSAEDRIALGGEIFFDISQTSSADAQKMIDTIRRKSRWHYSYIGLAESPGAVGPVQHWRELGAALAARDADAAAEATRRVIYFMQSEVMRVMVARGAGGAPEAVLTPTPRT